MKSTADCARTREGPRERSASTTTMTDEANLAMMTALLRTANERHNSKNFN